MEQSELEWSYDGIFWEPVFVDEEFGDGDRDVYVRVAHGKIKLSLEEGGAETRTLVIRGDDIKNLYET